MVLLSIVKRLCIPYNREVLLNRWDESLELWFHQMALLIDGFEDDRWKEGLANACFVVKKEKKIMVD